MIRCVYFSFTAALALLVCLLGRASCQLDCAEPTESDFANVISLVIPDSENPTTPEINLIRFRTVCLAYSQERGRFRGVSALVEYTCTGNAACPADAVVEQFEADCVDGSWSHLVRGSIENTRTQMPDASFTTTELRENCAFCYSPGLANAAGVPAGNTPDEENHCVACVGCSESPGQDRCTGIASCCNVYINGMCASDCPDDGVYVIDITTFECLEICPDLGNVVENGIVSYSQAIPEGEEGYSEGTTATVVCNTGYRGGGVIVCESGGEWSPFNSLPSCGIVDCGPPPELDNGNVTFDSTLIDSVATYECNEDYFFDDGTKTTRTCLESGEWSNENLQCITSTDSPSSQSESDNTPAIVGGVVAGAVFLITIAVTIVVLVLRKCTQIQKRDAGNEVCIQTTTNAAYEMSKFHEETIAYEVPDVIPTTSNEAYHVARQAGGTPGDYEIPQTPPSSTSPRPDL